MKRQQKHESRAELVGTFSYLDDVLSCIRRLKESHWTIEHVYSPVPSHDIQALLSSGTSSIRYFTFIGGTLGVLFGLALAAYAHLQWELITGGKPFLAWIPFFVIAFECCILFGVIATLIELSIMTRLPCLRLSEVYDARFSQDRFGIHVSCDETEQEIVSELLSEAGAEEVRKVTGGNKNA